MSWRDYRPTFLLRRDPGAIAHSIVNSSVRRAAEEYAGLLSVGSEILDDTDDRVVATFRHLLPALLSRRGLILAQIPGGWRVERAPFRVVEPAPAPPLPRLACGACGQPAFDCEHRFIWDAPR